MTPREQAIEVMGEAAKTAGHAVTRHERAVMLDALLSATQKDPCPTCGGAGYEAEQCSKRGIGFSYPTCATCEGSGRVPGTPLVILGPTLAHPTVRIPDDVPGWEGEILPAAYHDPLREPQVHNANEERA